MRRLKAENDAKDKFINQTRRNNEKLARAIKHVKAHP